MMRSFLVTLCLLLTAWAFILEPKHDYCPLGFDVEAECYHFNRAMELADRGKRAEAIREYQLAICIDPEDDLARENLNRLLQEEGEHSRLRLPIGPDRGNGQTGAANLRLAKGKALADLCAKRQRSGSQAKRTETHGT